MDKFLDFSGDLTILFSIINAILYFKSFARNNKAFKIFALYLISIATIQAISFYVGSVLHEHNLFLSHFYFVFQFVFLSLFYYELTKYKWIKWATLVVLVLIGFQYVDSPEIFFKYNPVGMSITHSILVLYSILYFYKNLSGKGEFLIVNVGIFFYLLSSTLIFASGNLVFNLNISDRTLIILDRINIVLYLIFQILIFIEWWRNYKKPVVN